MATNKGTKYEDFEAQLLSDPSIAKEYDSLKPKYDMIRCLIERRNKLRMSQTQLAKKVGMKQPAISRLETGNHNTTLNTFFKVTHALDLDISLKTKVH
jgi:predicted transcriptional regulator